uniref:pre-mRNA-processing factor 39 isoform X2 n=1 Tax=Doryrhamphus excisus TaxID=161450 RepID=UPI0025ADED23|nr:pre-mRNA-processing factor 39 isoform X2 [Doryrhamphus excisus]
MTALVSDVIATSAIMAAQGEVTLNGELGEPSATEGAVVPAPPDPETPDEDGTSGDPDSASMCLPPAAEDEAGAMPADFEHLWKAAHDSPHDFSGWTDLLQYCEQEGHLAASRRALAAFLARYPLCYGYWKKYADLERRAGNDDKASAVCVQGLRSIPLSVDLWIHYINLLLGTLDMDLPESAERIRSVFEDAVAAAGLDFHSDRLWDLYVEWEKEQGSPGKAAAILDRVLKVPTQLYNTHYDKLKAHLSSHEPREVLSLEEYEELRAFCHQSRKVERAEQAKDKEEERPPGEEELATPKGADSEEMMRRIREQVLLRRDKVYQENEDEVRKRWHFEDAIKRPYFHVRPLDHAQLRGWRSYLDWEMAQLKADGQDLSRDTEETAADVTHARDDHRLRVLFERCLIACALYEEFWTRYVEYLEPLSVDEARAVYKRACEIHLPSTPNIHLQRATFEEKHGDVAQARRVLEALEKNRPGLAVVRLRRAALERRAGRLERSEALLREAVAQSKEKPALHAFYAIKLARLLLKLAGDPGGARAVLQEALEISPGNAKLHLNLLELELEDEPWSSGEAVQGCVTRALAAPLASHTKLCFSRRGLQFAEEHGRSIRSVMAVYEEHQKLLTELSATKREAQNGNEEPEKKSKGDDGSVADGSAQAPDATPPVPITTPPPPDTSGQAGSGVLGGWYQQPQYCGYGYHTWNYNQGYYPPS